LERHWRGETDTTALHKMVRRVRAESRQWHRETGVTRPGSGNVTVNDRMADSWLLFGQVLSRFSDLPNGLDSLFVLARG